VPVATSVVRYPGAGPALGRSVCGAFGAGTTVSARCGALLTMSVRVRLRALVGGGAEVIAFRTSEAPDTIGSEVSEVEAVQWLMQTVIGTYQ
jgi:hypothetical protein